jgi:hypothetical protein
MKAKPPSLVYVKSTARFINKFLKSQDAGIKAIKLTAKRGDLLKSIEKTMEAIDSAGLLIEVPDSVMKMYTACLGAFPDSPKPKVADSIRAIHKWQVNAICSECMAVLDIDNFAVDSTGLVAIINPCNCRDGEVDRLRGEIKRVLFGEGQ